MEEFKINPIYTQLNDYKKLQSAFYVLRAQQKKALCDLGILLEKKEEATNNPKAFLESLDKTPLPIPRGQILISVPKVYLSEQYYKIPATKKSVQQVQSPATPNVDNNTLNNNINNSNNNNNNTHMNDSINTININNNSNNNNNNNSNNVLINVANTGNESSLMTENKRTSQDVYSDMDDFDDTGPPVPGEVVRGRLFTPQKPQSFNQLWTDEEQARLEALLQEFPNEEVAAHRWAKIANALGNRTPKQVASRTQKYFIKLQKMGLPVPGKIPNMQYYQKKDKEKKKRGPKKQKPDDETEQKGEFNPTSRTMIGNSFYIPPKVKMPEDEKDPLPPEIELLDPTKKGTPEYEELLRLLNERKIGKNERPLGTKVKHVGFSCDGCGQDPILDVRWRCLTCLTINPEGDDDGVDLCDECKQSMNNNNVNNLIYNVFQSHSAHEWEKVETPVYKLDDYQYQYLGGHNYLDPNFG